MDIILATIQFTLYNRRPSRLAGRKEKMNIYTVEDLIGELMSWINNWKKEGIMKDFTADIAFAYLAGYAPDAPMKICNDAVKALVEAGDLQYHIYR